MADIKSGCGYPYSSLSNFSPHEFVIDGIKCASMEGFLQSLKSPYPHVQEEICKLVGFTAKRRGGVIDWKRTQTLHWLGKEYKRDSDEYQELLDRAYEQLSLNDGFKRALLASGDSVLKHSIGKSNIKETVLTEREFCGRLMKLRTKLQKDV